MHCAWRVDLSDQAHGNVVADAVYVVRDDAAAESFTWTIPALDAGTIPAGSYAVYARWTSSSANSAAAAYTIAHAPASGPGLASDTVTVNQKQNGGQWRLLGTYGFAPGAGHNISLAASADGRVVADAIRLVAVGPPAADIVYLHPDQLGQPQKMTDAAKAVVWDRQAGPFGELEAISGLGQNPLRFPGQYADGETGFSYNCFRDYDPALGRYIESDPIGLAGGLNTYGYVGGNPVNNGDYYGLAPIVWPTGPTGITAAPGPWESLIPIWGPFKQSLHDWDCGDYLWSVFNMGLGASDIIPVRAAIGGIAKGAWKFGGHSWTATKGWYAKTRGLNLSLPVHHWLIPQNGWGKPVWEWLKNQPWNLMPMPSRPFHVWLHHHATMLEQLWYGTPSWFKAMYASGLGRDINAARANAASPCDCAE